MSDPRIGIAQRNAPGESVCGDAYTVLVHDRTILIALADGLGHGPSAAKAAVRFCDVVRETPDLDLEAILQAAQAPLALTRGAAVALARIDLETAQLEFSGVGNVELRARSRSPIAPACAPGIMGGRVRRTMLFRYPIHPADLLVLHTDGIVGLTDLAPLDGLPPQRTADLILETFASGKDDATCIAVRLGRGVYSP